MIDHDWQVVNKDEGYWGNRNTNKNALTLFTLPGTKLPGEIPQQNIKNLLVRSLPNGCFTTEPQLADFVPQGQWQQAGLLLMEEIEPGGSGILVSLVYNHILTQRS